MRFIQPLFAIFRHLRQIGLGLWLPFVRFRQTGRTRWLIPLILFSGLTILLSGRLFQKRNLVSLTHLPSAQIGKILPKFKLPLFSAPTPTSSVLEAENAPTLGYMTEEDLKKGFPVLIHVFASWCATCTQDHAPLQKIREKFRAEGKKIQILGVARKNTAEDLGTFFARDRNPYDYVLLDQDGRFSIDLGVYGIPETFFIQGDGRILYRHAGPLTENLFSAIFL